MRPLLGTILLLAAPHLSAMDHRPMPFGMNGPTPAMQRERIVDPGRADRPADRASVLHYRYKRRT